MKETKDMIVVFELLPKPNSVSYEDDEDEVLERVMRRLYLIADELGLYVGGMKIITDTSKISDVWDVVEES